MKTSRNNMLLVMLAVFVVCMVISVVAYRSKQVELSAPPPEVLLNAELTQAYYQQLANDLAEVSARQAGACFIINPQTRGEILEVLTVPDQGEFKGEALVSIADNGCMRLNRIVLRFEYDLNHQQIVALLHKEASILTAAAMIQRDIGWEVISDLVNSESELEVDVIADGLAFLLQSRETQLQLLSYAELNLPAQQVEELDCAGLQRIDILSQAGAILRGGVSQTLQRLGC